MLLSTQFNTIQTVQSNLENAFKDFAGKCVRYIKALGKNRRPRQKLLIREYKAILQRGFHQLTEHRKDTIRDLVDYVCSTVQKKRQRDRGANNDSGEADFAIPCRAIRRCVSIAGNRTCAH